MHYRPDLLDLKSLFHRRPVHVSQGPGVLRSLVGDLLVQPDTFR